MKIIFFLFLFVPTLLFAQSPQLPSASERITIVRNIAEEIYRMDGEGLLVRENRPDKFSDIVTVLEKEAQIAQNWPDFLLTLKRLDQSFPNLHARFEPGKMLQTNNKIIPTVGFMGEWLSPGYTRYKISRVDPDLFPPESKPLVGDLLIGINGKSIEEWKKEHFNFCKFALREQCDLNFSSDFYNELSGWTRKEPLSYTFQREEKIWTLTIPLKNRPSFPNNDDELLCANSPNRYSDFHMVYGGKFACFFEKNNDPATMILRITSFYYYKDTTQGPKSPREEVNAFMPYWQNKASQTKHLIIDVSDNGGGNETTPYYEIFFDRPYQEQWVRFKKIPELEDPELRNTFFWGSNAQEIWFQNIKKEGVWDSTPYGAFLPPVPMFCVDENQDCRQGQFSVNNPGFKGKISLIVNQWCVSSCDAFIFTFKQELSERVKIIGQPQAADSAYSRIRIGIQNDLSVKLLPQYGGDMENILLSQTIPISRSVTKDGIVTSGKPLPVDRFVPSTMENDDWYMSAVQAALEY